MPNHVTTILTLDPEAAAALKGDAGPVDFNALIPMPDEVANTTVASNALSFSDPRGWYGWSLENWGTKWNAYAVEITAAPGDHAVVQFDTAWSHPYPIVEELSRRFPDQPIHVRYADEDLGSNFGEYVILDGTIAPNVDLPAEGTDEGRDFAAQVKYGQSYAEFRAEWS